LAPVSANAIAAATPAGPPPITATSYVPDASFISGQLTFPAAFSSPHQAAKVSPDFARRNAASADVQIGAIPDSTARQMDQLNQQDSSLPSPAARAAAFSVHIFTALGAGIALLALLEAVREHWAAMFALLGVALVVDALDGPIARWLDVVRAQPNWSGEVLDLVVDFVTYVFVPAYAITASGLLLPLAAPLLGAGIVVSGALYFADRRMKAADNHFRGFPALWNAAAFYLFLLHLPAALSSLAVAVLIVLTFVPFHVLHPIRVMRLRGLTLSLLAVWAVLAMITLALDFDVGTPTTIALCAIAAYIVGSDAIIRLAKSFSA
jgi:phosphatidylcholine synthase